MNSQRFTNATILLRVVVEYFDDLTGDVIEDLIKLHEREMRAARGEAQTTPPITFDLDDDPDAPLGDDE